MQTTETIRVTECPICGGDNELPDDTIQGELLECQQCGTELEVTDIEPYTLEEAPEIEEDWGE